MEHRKFLDDLYLDSAWATIGSFDGVHRGHQQIIKKLVEEAHQAGARAVVITFYPHPAAVVRGLSGPFFLTSPEERAALLDELGVDVVLTLQFDKQMASLTAEEFMRELTDHIGLKKLFVGYDFALGKNRQGDVSTLRRLGQEMGYEVEVIEPVMIDGEIVSSSRIRNLLNQGDVAAAANLLGRPYCISGQVTHGDGRGRTIGIPTANLAIWSERIIPAVGVYATRAEVGGQKFASVTNIGVRPTFENQPVIARVEVHLMDVDLDLYGQTVSLEFVQHLRREQRFPSVDALIQQIHTDIQQAREILDHVP